MTDPIRAARTNRRARARAARSRQQRCAPERPGGRDASRGRSHRRGRRADPARGVQRRGGDHRRPRRPWHARNRQRRQRRTRGSTDPRHRQRGGRASHGGTAHRPRDGDRHDVRLALRGLDPVLIGRPELPDEPVAAGGGGPRGRPPVPGRRGGSRAGRAGQHRQEQIPRGHEPRDPHADERDHRDERAPAGHGARPPSSATTHRWSSSSAEALLAIINDILDFSKIEAGKMELEHEAVQPARVRRGRDGHDRADRAAARASTSSTTSTHDMPDAIVGDVTRLRQILLNLLNNAVKFTEPGEVEPDRPCAAGRPTVGWQRATSWCATPASASPPTRSTGCSSPSARPTCRPRRRYGGTGLGLAISRRLAELMGGTVWARAPASGPAARSSTCRIVAASVGRRAPPAAGARRSSPAAGCSSSTTTTPTGSPRGPLATAWGMTVTRRQLRGRRARGARAATGRSTSPCWT